MIFVQGYVVYKTVLGSIYCNI